MIFGHRGLSSLAPENTMAAFRSAVDHQVAWVEADVDIIADGTVIVCHDSTLDRTTNRSGRYDGLTVADPAGRVVFVRHALPGETVRARLTEMTSRTWRADAVEILQASPDRVESVWPEAGPAGVGGGELAHVALDAQRTWKRWVLADCLRRIGGQEVADAVASLPEASAGAAVPIEPMPTDAAAQSRDAFYVGAQKFLGFRSP